MLVPWSRQTNEAMNTIPRTLEPTLQSSLCLMNQRVSYDISSKVLAFYDKYFPIHCYFTIPFCSLGSVNEVWSVVACNPDLVWRLSFVHVVSSSAGSQSVLSLEQDMHQDSTSEQEECLVSQDCSMAREISRSLFEQEYVAANLFILSEFAKNSNGRFDLPLPASFLYRLLYR